MVTVEFKMLDTLEDMPEDMHKTPGHKNGRAYERSTGYPSKRDHPGPASAKTRMKLPPRIFTISDSL
jgi:hypothetical protein